MTISVFAVLFGAFVAALVGVTRWRRRTAVADGGTVSAQWLAQQRANRRPYSD